MIFFFYLLVTTTGPSTTTTTTNSSTTETSITTQITTKTTNTTATINTTTKVVGQVVIGGAGGGKKRRRRKRETIPEVQAILKAAFCNEIPASSIVLGSCDLQVLAYNQTTGVCDYLLTFDILDAPALEVSLNDINDNIATNTAITESGLTASPGTIGK